MKIKNVSGEDLLVPWLGHRLVSKGQVVEVEEEQVYNFTQQSIWEPADEDAQNVHDEAEKVYAPLAEALAGEPLEVPARNATREAWATYVVAAGLAPDLESLDGKGRDQIRDEFSKEVI